MNEPIERAAQLPLARRFRNFLPVVVDVETGGLNAARDALLEIAAVFIEIEPAGALAERRPVDVTKPEPEMPPVVALMVTSPPEVVLVSTTLPAL